MDLVRPLWQQPQQELLNEMWERHFEKLVTYFNLKKIPVDILDKVQDVYGVGKPLTQVSLNAIVKANTNISLAGKFGELYSMVLNCSFYNHSKVGVKSENLFLFLKLKMFNLLINNMGSAFF